MEALMLEVKTRGLHRYYRLEQPVTRIGRALDNDIILSDPTVAAYHLRLTRDPDGLVTVENLAEVNPAKINDIHQNRFETTHPPIKLQLGRVVANILSPDHLVADTRSLAGHGRGLHLFRHSGWAFLLPVICLLAGGLEYYFGSFSTLKWDILSGYVIRETALHLAIFIVGLSVVERLLVNRWEVRLVTICVSLTYLLFVLSTTLINEIMYLLSSQWPSILFGISWYLFFIPAAISLYLIKISHFKVRQSIVLAILISSPFSIPELMDNPIKQHFVSDFRSSANYHNKLSPLNLHLLETVPINTFIQQAEKLETGEFVD